MKKAWLIPLVITIAALVFALSGCASGNSREKTGETTEPEEQTAIPNPWSDASSADEAAAGAGLESFSVTDDLGLASTHVQPPTFRYMEGIAEADYDGGAFQMCVRKSAELSGQDLSGDYNEYPFQWTMETDAVMVTCRGYEEGMASAFDWERGDATFSVVLTGLGGENMALDSVDVGAVVRNVQ